MPKKTVWEDISPDPIPSLGVLDPYARLAAGVLVQAIQDLEKRDPIKSLDAFCWLVDDGLILLQVLEFNVSESRIFRIFGGIHGTRKFKESKPKRFNAKTTGNSGAL